MNEAVSPGALSTLFTDARTHNGWRETPVSDETLREIYALMKWGPTSANCSPARIVFTRTAEGKDVLETIRKVIETAGGTMADVTFNSIFITDWKNYAAINEIYAEFFPGDKPARFCIQCGLVKPDALVEIATIAHIAK